jgi:metal iron transporter
MNQTSRTDDTSGHPEWNQNPPSLNADATTRQDLNGIANSREHRSTDAGGTENGTEITSLSDRAIPLTISAKHPNLSESPRRLSQTASAVDEPLDRSNALTLRVPVPRFLRSVFKFATFIGPGFLIAVAYIDPGNYATDVSAGAQSKYALLFVVMMSNLIAIFLQSLCIKLGTVTGLNLAEMCRVHLPKWLNLVLYLLAESAIVATDIAEVFACYPSCT